MLIWPSYQANRARDEFKSTVNPDELRAWALFQLSRHPESDYVRDAAKEWPANFPHFRADSFHQFLHHANESEGPNGRRGVILAWSFRNQDLTIAVWLNPDGRPPR
ncbi:hypothetical protein DES53_102970 [Roseimicrobium gellanilyticum]|uniref:Uncharacterized protein n=1 Tax=Roseimicrobium gellanilyticum TaxID=748857 RepID=A0A366HTK7_9BACT|nr:hypothetical protein DES53_102970 [Roseimicrobium gellanilyticum]